uniref:b(0,+)-type amino acid transporter 1 n=1 Tax=Latimeria chalumnae TaxID=7897 RepID=H3AHW9_LATCH
ILSSMIRARAKEMPNVSQVTEEENENTEKLKLRREVGLLSAVSLIAGTMVGSGIFMSPEWLLRSMGSPGGSLLIWAACGLLTMLSALSYAELGQFIAESGGEYIYLLRIFGQVPAFLLIFTSVLVVRPAGIAAVSLSLGEYLSAPFYPGCSPPQIVIKWIAAACILVLCTVNSINVRLATHIQTFFAAAKLIALLIIVVGGLVLLVNGQTSTFQNAFQGTQTSIGTIGVAFYQGLWSYEGWNNLNSVTEELKHPEVNLLRAVIIAVPLVTLLYLLVNVSYFAAMTPSEMTTSKAVAVTWGNKVLGSWAWLMPLSVVLSTFGSINGMFFTGGRVCYIAAREGQMPNILSMVHVRHFTPSPALIFTSIMSLIMIIPGNFGNLVNFFSFTAWIFYSMTFAGLLYLKIKKSDFPRAYKVPIIIPIFMLIAAVCLVVAPIVDNPKIEYLYVSLSILSGLIVYAFLYYFQCCPGLTKATLFLQLLLEVSPTDKDTN